MREIASKTAFITGAASCIGLAMGRAFAQAGMNVMLADIETDALHSAVKGLHNVGPGVHGVACDVADLSSVEQAAKTTYENIRQCPCGLQPCRCRRRRRHRRDFARRLALGAGSQSDGGCARWHSDFSAAHPCPRRGRPYCQHRLPGRDVCGLGFGPYSASKFAVVTMSEGLAMELKPLGIGVSVLCPGFVRTRIGESSRNRPERYGPARTPDPNSPIGQRVAQITELIQTGMEPSQVAQRVLNAIRNDELYVFTHPERHADVEARFTAILSAMDKAAAEK